MKYPQSVDPFPNHDAFLAWMFGLLAAAYSRLAQYEDDDRKREHDQFIETFTTPKQR